MANRHLSRSIVMQTLFEWDSKKSDEGVRLDTTEILDRNISEFAPGMSDVSFMKRLLDGVLEKKPDIDHIIEKAAPDWPLEKISTIDRNILRIGLYELLFADRNEVPTKVAINEAIELAKSFGGESSGRFVNGVLGAVYKELGEPGKDEGKKTRNGKRDKFNIPYEEMPIKKLCGAVVYAKDNDDIYLALVHDVFGHWTLSKGHVKEGEVEKEAVKRIVSEEIGLAINVEESLGKNEYVASNPEAGKIRKQVSYFLAKSNFQDLKLEEDAGGLDDAKWFRLQDILDLNFYDDILPIVTNSVNILLKK
jgi:transcription antitermination protein NusB